MALADSYEGHPLLSDSDRLDTILDRVHDRIKKVLFKGKGPPRGRGSSEPSIRGGVSVEDVLQEVFQDLLTHAATQSEDRNEEWAPLANSMADNKSKDALDRANKGLKATEARSELTVVSADALARRDYERPDPKVDTEEEALGNLRAQQMEGLIRELLTTDERWLFVQIMHLRRTRKSIADELGLTGQRIGQRYEQILRRLESDPRNPYRND